MLVSLFINPALGVYIKDIFAYLTTAYVSLRLGYTAKAGIENYKKIAMTFKELAGDNSEEEENDQG